MKKIQHKKRYFLKIFFFFFNAFTVLSLLYSYEVSNIHIYKINGNKILKIWDLKLICKTLVHLHLFQVTVVP